MGFCKLIKLVFIYKYHFQNFHFQNSGFFVECGAGDGELFSNSLYFEVRHNWTGLLVEDNPDWLEKLRTTKRNVWILPHCLSKSDKVELIKGEKMVPHQ